MLEKQKIQLLYNKYINLTCTEEEWDEFFDLLKNEKNLEFVQSLLCQLWDQEEDFNPSSTLGWTEFLQKRKQLDSRDQLLGIKRRNWLLLLSVAASLFMVIGGTTLFSKYWEFENQPTSLVVRAHIIEQTYSDENQYTYSIHTLIREHEYHRSTQEIISERTGGLLNNFIPYMYAHAELRTELGECLQEWDEG